MNVVVTLIQNLINSKFYKTKEEVYSKIDVFFAVGRITSDEYTSLAELINETYTEVII